MDISRSAKRLLIIVALSVIVILVSKSLLSKAVKNLNIAAEKKLQAKSSKLPVLPESAPAQELPSVIDTSSAPLSAGSIETIAESTPVSIRSSTGDH